MHKKLILLFVLTLTSSFYLAAQKPGSLTAVDFDGTDDYIMVPDNSAINPTSKITVEAWIKADAYSKNYFGNSIFCKHGWSSGNKGYVLRCGDNGKLNFNISDSAGVWKEVGSGSVMTTGVWYHVAGVFTGDSIIVYVNGNLEASIGYKGPMSPSTGLDGKIGDLAFGNGRYFDGQIDELRIWNTALTKETIRNWMCRKVTKSHANYSNLAAYYKLDDGTGVDAADQSAGSNKATLTNGPQWVASGAALGDTSAYVYAGTSFSLPTKYGDIFTVKNIVGAPAMVHAYASYIPTIQPASKNVIGAIDSTHFFGVFYDNNTAVKFDINYNFKNSVMVKGAKKCGVNMFVKVPGNTGTWDYTASKLYDAGDSLVIKKQTKNEFVMALYQTDSSKLLFSVSGKNWFCDGDSLLLSASGNDSFNYVWYKNGGVLSGKTKKTLWVSAVGNYKVKMTRRATSCSFTSTSIAVTSRTTLVTWSYSNTVCQNNDSIKLSPGSPAGGFFSGKWVTPNGYFHPRLAGTGAKIIYYNFIDTNNCVSRASATITLLDTALLSITPPSSLCTNAVPLNLSVVSPSGGAYKGLGVSANIFSASAAGKGNHSINYTYTKSNTCISKTNFTIPVFKPDSTSILIKDKACNTDEPILVYTFPSGGTLKGSAVIGQNFYPLFADKGFNWVFYLLTDSHKCDVKDSAKIYISELPKASITKFSSVCDNANDFTLSGGQPIDSGKYWIDGILNSKFSPKSKGKGLYKIEYKVVNYFGCRDSATATIRVNASPVKPAITISKNKLISSSISGNQWLDKNGVISGANQQEFNPTMDGIYFVKVTNDSNCSNISDSVQFAKVGIHQVFKSNCVIYPNPSANGIFNLEGSSGLSVIQVQDMVGRERMKLNQTKSKMTLDLSSLGTGTYFITIKTKDSVYSQRVVVY